MLRPSKLVNDLIAGVLALAEEHYEVEVVAFVALSNHFHALLIPAEAVIQQGRSRSVFTVSEDGTPVSHEKRRNPL